mgnify:CR=1 FL=1
MASKIFESFRTAKPGYSGFDLSHDKKLTCQMAQLIPILHEEILPGDYFKIRSEIMVRLAPMVAPVMHRVNVYVHYFFVPNRIIWDQWEEFITGGQDGTSLPSMPTVTYDSNFDVGSLADYLGIGGYITSAVYEPELNALPFRAYQEIFNSYYRNPTIDNEIDYTIEANAIQLRTRRWEKDYFTSCLPFTQRGGEVGSPITFNPQQFQPDRVYNTDVNPPVALTGADLGTGVAGDLERLSDNVKGSIDNTSNLDILINDLRNSSALQRWLENNARGGYRYVEQLLHRWGVKSSDARLNRPEYLGGGRQPIVFSEVLNTSATATQPQGEMAGHGISVGLANKAKKRFEEHGQLFGIMSILPRTSYYTGIPKKFLRLDKLDYYSPEFANLGEQEVQSQELYYNSGGAFSSHTAVFGYQQRWAEYKYCMGSHVHGDFRDSLEFWHMGRDFASRPTLNPTFVSAGDVTDRIFASTTDDPCWIQVYNDVKARRPMPYYANPSLR